MLMTYFAFPTREKAVKFEKYLKAESGIAFSRKHFLNYKFRAFLLGFFAEH